MKERCVKDLGVMTSDDYTVDEQDEGTVVCDDDDDDKSGSETFLSQGCNSTDDTLQSTCSFSTAILLCADITTTQPETVVRQKPPQVPYRPHRLSKVTGAV